MHRAVPSIRFLDALAGVSVPPQKDHRNLQAWNDHDGSAGLFCQARGSQHWIWWPGLAAYCFDLDRNEVDVCSEPEANRRIVLDSYWRHILPIIEHVRGRECLHASAIRGDGLVLLCGDSTNGKSTLAYGLKERGYVFWADDAVVIETMDGLSYAVPIPFKIHLRAPSLAYFGSTANAPEFQLQSHPEVESGSSPEIISTIFVLERRSEAHEGNLVDSSILPPHESLINLLTHARCFSLKDESRKRQMLQNYMQLVKNVPTIRFRFASGLDRLPKILDRLEKEIVLACKGCRASTPEMQRGGMQHGQQTRSVSPARV